MCLKNSCLSVLPLRLVKIRQQAHVALKRLSTMQQTPVLELLACSALLRSQLPNLVQVRSDPKEASLVRYPLLLSFLEVVALSRQHSSDAATLVRTSLRSWFAYRFSIPRSKPLILPLNSDS